jgi:hypothetical protein
VCCFGVWFAPQSNTRAGGRLRWGVKIALMGIDLQLRTAGRRRLVWTLILLAPGILAGIAGLRGWPAWTVVAVLAIVAGLPWLAWKTSRPKPAYPQPKAERTWSTRARESLLVVAVLTFGVAMYHAARPAALDLWGSQAQARVERVDVVESKRSTGRSQERYNARFLYFYDYCFHLSRPDGSPGFGRICRDAREFQLGEWIDVVADRAGIAAPDTPDQVAGARPWGFAVLGSLAVLAGYGWVIGGRPVPVPVPRPPLVIRRKAPPGPRRPRKRPR